jgi:hypothetical protein
MSETKERNPIIRGIRFFLTDSFLARFTLVQIVGGLLISSAWYFGWVSLVLNTDKTFMTQLIIAVFLVGLILGLFKRWDDVFWVSNSCLFLGLIGTVLGFIIAFSGIDPSAVGDIEAIKPMVTILMLGMGTALYTTLVGAIGSLWLQLNLQLFDRDEKIK